MAALYLVLAVLGAVLPYAKLLPWIADHGVDPGAFVQELFATRAGEVASERERECESHR